MLGVYSLQFSVRDFIRHQRRNWMRRSLDANTPHDDRSAPGSHSQITLAQQLSMDTLVAADAGVWRRIKHLHDQTTIPPSETFLSFRSTQIATRVSKLNHNPTTQVGISHWRGGKDLGLKTCVLIQSMKQKGLKNVLYCSWASKVSIMKVRIQGRHMRRWRLAAAGRVGLRSL